MTSSRFYYLLELQYLGFRYHGWQKQPKLKTVQERLEKTLRFILRDIPFKTLASGRTDAMVSANQAFCEVFTTSPLELRTLKEGLNKNLPQDIKVTSIKEISKKFNIINQAKEKNYLYLFSYGKKNHPFAAPFMTNITENLDIELMKQGANSFEGEHFFHNYTAFPHPDKQVKRIIQRCQIKENTLYTANFFPEKSYMLDILGCGFGRHQIRLMMGTLLNLGFHKMSLEDLKESLQIQSTNKQTFKAPASGLILHKLTFDEFS